MYWSSCTRVNNVEISKPVTRARIVYEKNNSPTYNLFWRLTRLKTGFSLGFLFVHARSLTQVQFRFIGLSRNSTQAKCMNTSLWGLAAIELLFNKPFSLSHGARSCFANEIFVVHNCGQLNVVIIAHFARLRSRADFWKYAGCYSRSAEEGGEKTTDGEFDHCDRELAATISFNCCHFEVWPINILLWLVLTCDVKDVCPDSHSQKRPHGWLLHDFGNGIYWSSSCYWSYVNGLVRSSRLALQ